MVKPVLGLRCIELLYRHSRTDNGLYLRDQVDENLRVASQGLAELGSPLCKPFFGLTEELPHQTSKSLSDRAVGDVALKLIEFAFTEVASTMDDRLVNLTDQRRFADARIARHQHESLVSTGNVVECF